MKHLTWICLGLAGCTVYATEPAAPVGAHPESARVCVIRASALAFAAPVTVHDNELLVGATQPVTYFCYLAEPGAHVITSTLGDDIDRSIGTSDISRTTIAAQAGVSYYLVQEVNAFGVHGLAWVDEARAAELTRGCEPVRLARVPDDEALPRPDVAAPALPLAN